jgi:hypothetical protein
MKKNIRVVRKLQFPNKSIIAVFMIFLCAVLFAQNNENDFTVDANGTITRYNGWDSNVVIPRQIRGVVIRAIGPRVFESSDLTGVTIPDSVVSIGEGAFARNRLTSVNIPAGVTFIGNEAFRNNQLTSLTISGRNVSIGSSAFRDNRLANATVSGSGVTINSEAFAGNPLTGINLGSNHIFESDIVPMVGYSPSSLFYDYVCNDRRAGTYTANRSIGNVRREGDYSYYAAQYGAYITNYHGSGGNRLVIPGELGGLPVKALSGFDGKNIGRVQIPGSVTYVGNAAFRGNQITTAVIPDSVTYIGSYAFEDNQLTTVTIPRSVTYLGWGAFRNNQLSNATIAEIFTRTSATVTEITPGMAYNAILQGNEQLYRVTVPTGTLKLTAYTESGMDTVICVYSAAGNVIAEDDDSGSDYNARASVIVSAGTYFIGVREYDGGAGQYSLNVLTESVSVTTITPGRPYNATLQGNEQYYQVTISAGRLSAYTDGSLDTVIRIYNSAWNVLTEDDDSGSDYNARASVIVSAGTYFIGVREYDGGAGQYSLNVLIEPISATTITPGRAYNATLQGNEQLYQVNVSSGKLTAYTDSNIDTLIFIYDAAWNVIAEDDDSGSGYNAMASVNVSAGTYFIGVRGYGGETGQYTLNVLLQ